MAAEGSFVRVGARCSGSDRVVEERSGGVEGSARASRCSTLLKFAHQLQSKPDPAFRFWLCFLIRDTLIPALFLWIEHPTNIVP